MSVVEIHLNFLHIVQQFLSKWHLALSFITKFENYENNFKIFISGLLFRFFRNSGSCTVVGRCRL